MTFSRTYPARRALSHGAGNHPQRHRPIPAHQRSRQCPSLVRLRAPASPPLHPGSSTRCTSQRSILTFPDQAASQVLSHCLHRARWTMHLDLSKSLVMHSKGLLTPSIGIRIQTRWERRVHNARFPEMLVGDDVLSNIDTGFNQDVQSTFDKSAQPPVRFVDIPGDVISPFQILHIGCIMSARIFSNKRRSTIAQRCLSPSIRTSGWTTSLSERTTSVGAMKGTHRLPSSF